MSLECRGDDCHRQEVSGGYCVECLTEKVEGIRAARESGGGRMVVDGVTVMVAGAAAKPEEETVESKAVGRPKGQWNRERVLAAISLFTERNGRPPKTTDWPRSTEEYPNFSIIYKFFESMADAVKEAGIDTSTVVTSRVLVVPESMVQPEKDPADVKIEVVIDGAQLAADAHRHMALVTDVLEARQLVEAAEARYLEFLDEMTEHAKDLRSV